MVHIFDTVLTQPVCTFSGCHILIIYLSQLIEVLQNLIVTHLVKKFSASYGTRRFITVFKGPATGPYPEPHESSPYFPNLSP